MSETKIWGIRRPRQYSTEQQVVKAIKGREASQAWRVRAIMFLGGACNRCGFDDMRALQIDHINGDGAEHRRQISGNNSGALSRFVVKNPQMFQILCANCNWIKRYENHEHTLVTRIKEN